MLNAEMDDGWESSDEEEDKEEEKKEEEKEEEKEDKPDKTLSKKERQRLYHLEVS